MDAIEGDRTRVTAGGPHSAIGQPRIASVIGWSGSGKTTLVSRAITECARRGISCVAAKRARHAPDIAPEGKDSTRFLQAGAEASAYVGDSGAALFLPPPSREDRDYFLGLLPPSELLFLEGAVVEGAIRVLLAGRATDLSELKRPLGEVDLLVAFDPSLRESAKREGKPAIHPDDIAGFIDILMEHHGGTKMETRNEASKEREVSILCDGKSIPLVPFVERLFADTIAAMTGSLKGGENASEITITVRTKK